MCTPLIALAAVGVGLSGVGAIASYKAGVDAQNATENAQESAMMAQNTAFDQRMQAEGARTAAEGQAFSNSANIYNQIQGQEESEQNQALSDRSNVLNAINTQENQIAQQGNQAVATATQAVTPAAAAAAPGAQMAQQQALNAPVQANIQASDPLGADDTGPTRQAMDAGRAGAARYVQQYGDSLAKLSGYSAPIELANNTATTLGTNLMPAGAADQLLKTGASAQLLPSTLAYEQAGTYAQDANAANATMAAQGKALADDQAQNAVDLANLQQGDSDSMIQGNLNLAQMRAARLAGLGQGVSQLGNTALMFAGAKGAFSGLFGSSPTGSVTKNGVTIT